MRSDAALAELARLLRRYHDATAGYVAPPRAPWQWADPDPRRHEVICHNDAAPYNTALAAERPRAFIDFDNAGPGPRVWDVAYAAYTFVPLSRGAPTTDGTLVPHAAAAHASERQRRLRLLTRAYGLDDAAALLPSVARRLQALCDALVERAAGGDVAHRRLIEAGHWAHCQQELDFFRAHAAEWQVNVRDDFR